MTHQAAEGLDRLPMPIITNVNKRVRMYAPLLHTSRGRIRVASAEPTDWSDLITPGN